MATNGNRNRRAGHGYELDEVKRHQRYFHDVVSTRSCNRTRDGEGIDICNATETTIGRLPVDISCKSMAKSSVAYAKLLDEMASGRIKVVLHRRTKKSSGGKFMTKGEYAITDREGYEQFLQHVYAIQLLRKSHPDLVRQLEEVYSLELINVPQQILP